MTKTASPATDRQPLLEALNRGLVEFDYLKTDGEFRTVRGTTNYGTIEINGGDQDEASTRRHSKTTTTPSSSSTSTPTERPSVASARMPSSLARFTTSR